MYDARIIRKINQGRCFALVGSGPSNELGYPSWAALAQTIYAEVKGAGRISDEPSYVQFLDNGKYPELFRQAELDLGSRGELVSLLSRLMRPHTRGKTGFIYDLLVKWPFACYLTTNYEDEVHTHLERSGVFYKTIGNTQKDLALIRHDASHLIVKLHGDLNDPQNLILTSQDYSRLAIGAEGQYFRDRLRVIFETFDICIVGHSLRDRDIELILQTARQTASPEHPIFLIASDVTKGEERELLEHFNVVTLPYENPDGKHMRLRRMLGMLDKFITPRRERLDIELKPYSAEELEAAQAILIYRRITALTVEEFSPVQYLGPIVLQSFKETNGPLSDDELLKNKPLSMAVATEEVRKCIQDVLQELARTGLLSTTDGMHLLTTEGIERRNQVANQRRLEEEQAYGQFAAELRAQHQALTTTEEGELVGIFRDTLVKVFRQRGLSIANAIFAGQSMDSDGLSDVFQALSRAGGLVTNPELALTFIECAQRFLLEPTEPQKQYIASLSQGYFLYHLFGLDPRCAKIRRDIFGHTIWWSDSSVLLPLLAQGCMNHAYAADLFARLQKVGAFTLTTDLLLHEVWEHLEWVVRLLERESVESPAFMAAALMKGSYKQNLFLDGYIRLSAEGRVSRFKDYLELVFPKGYSKDALTDSLKEKGLTIVNAHDLKGYQAEDRGEIVDLSKYIKEVRSNLSSFRSDLQVEAEAEILHIIRSLQNKKYESPVADMNLERSYFLSQSRVLDKVPPVVPISWTPEALYRYLIALPGETIDAGLLQQCMMQEYYSSGVVLVDKRRYQKFFGPSINAAKTKYAEERDKYLKEAATSPAKVDELFAQTPDLEKPFFVQQMGWRVAEHAKRAAEAATKKAAEAEAQIEALRAEKDAAWKRKKRTQERQDAAYQRHLSDPDYQRKRRKQAKRRARKKRR